MSDPTPYRLPRTIVPERYQIQISPDLVACAFTGTEQVTVTVGEPVDQVVLNAAELTIHEAELVSESGLTIAATVTLDDAEERAVLALAATAEPGTWTLRLAFSGTINDKLKGFYRSTFRDDDGVEQVIATTQFEATDARRAFPCWDEPDRKAVFSISLVVPEGLAAFSNSSELERTSRDDGSTLVRFADTMRMSSYLVAYVVGPLEATTARNVDGVPLRVVHAPRKGHLCDFALEVGAHALHFFAEWFGIPYPADKLDLVAVPDFAFGAMENLGAVTFRESLLLVDPSAASRVELERVADVICHEIAHMWFGDLVTMSWWNGLWLNEAFATFMELLAVDSFRPEWDRWVSFGLSRGAALSIDGLSTTRAIEFPVARPEEAEGMFDTLTYQKGAGVLRMLERYLGAEPFRQGIITYLNTHSHGNADTTDLWDAIEKATDEPARTTMDSWIFQPGYPLVGVEATDDGLELSQHRFTYRPMDDTTRWNIPVLIRASVGGAEVERRTLLSEGTELVGLGGRPDWAVVNAGGWGFYRVGYSSELASGLAAQFNKLNALERFNVLSDANAAVVAGVGGLAEYLGLIEQLDEGDDPAVWTVALGGLELLHRVVSEPDRPAVEAFVRRVAGTAFAQLGWHPAAGEPTKVGTVRATLLSALGSFAKDGHVVERAAALHRGMLEDRASVDPDLAAAIVSIAARAGGRAEYEAFLDRFRHPATPQEEVRYLYALAAFERDELIAQTLDLAMGEVRTQNAPFLIQGLFFNPVGGFTTWRYVKANWDKILDRLPSHSIPRMLEGLTALTSAAVAEDVLSFLAEHPIPSGQQTLDQTLERLRINVAYAQRVQSGIADQIPAGQG